MANIYEKSVFEFKSQITVSSSGSNFTTLIATDDLNPNLQVITGDSAYPITVTWANSAGRSGFLTEETTTSLTNGHFMVEYPATADVGYDNRLRITMQDTNISASQYTVTVTVAFYASVKPGQFDSLLNESPLENTMYFNIDTADIETATPAEMDAEALQKFDLRVLGNPVTIDKKQGIDFNAIYVFNGFTDKTLIDNSLIYRFTIEDLPQVGLTSTGITVIDSNTGDTVPFTATDVGTGDVQVDINYLDAKGKTVLISVPAISTQPIELPAVTSPLYIPCKGQLLDTTATPFIEVDFSNTNVEVTLRPSSKTLSGGVKTLA